MKFYIGNSIVNFLISWQSENFLGKSRFLIDFLSKTFGFFPMIQKMHVLARKPLRTLPFIARVLVDEKLLFPKILEFIAWPPHIL